MGVSWKQRFFPQPFQILARALPQALGSRSELPAWCCQDCQGCGALLDPLCSLGRLILAVQDLVLASHMGWEWESPSGRCAAGASPGELCLHHLETLTQDLRLSPFMWCKPRAPVHAPQTGPRGQGVGTVVWWPMSSSGTLCPTASWAPCSRSPECPRVISVLWPTGSHCLGLTRKVAEISQGGKDSGLSMRSPCPPPAL